MKHHLSPVRPLRRFDRRAAPDDPDPYGVRTSQTEPLHCLVCGAAYVRGQWTWSAIRGGWGRPVMCAACRRTREGSPAGHVHMQGAFFAAHRADIERLLARRAAGETERHPMRRIIGIRDAVGGAEVLTTDMALARELGAALQDAFQGVLHEVHTPGEFGIRVYWAR